MTKEEMLKQLGAIREHCKSMIPQDEPESVWSRDVEALDMAISTLRAQQYKVVEIDPVKNDPLTPDELREMDGEPVWTVTAGVSGSGRWELCTCETICACQLHKVLRCVTADGEVTDYDLDTYGKTWTAYRQKPEDGKV